jgi:hypothetical protein
VQKLFSHRPHIGYSINHYSALVPVWDFSIPNEKGSSAVKNPFSYGDSFPLPYKYKDDSHSEVTKVFGIEFSDTLLEIVMGCWHFSG